MKNMELSKLTAVEIPRFPDPRIGPFLFHGKDERKRCVTKWHTLSFKSLTV